MRVVLLTQLEQTTSRGAARMCLLLSACAAAWATHRALQQHWEPQSQRGPPLMKSNRCSESSDTWWNSWKFFRRPGDCWPPHHAPAAGDEGSEMFRYSLRRMSHCTTILFEGALESGHLKLKLFKDIYYALWYCTCMKTSNNVCKQGEKMKQRHVNVLLLVENIV